MGLDVNTSKGKKSVRDETVMLRYIEECWGVRIIETNKETAAAIDGFVVDDTIVAVFESKCRYNIDLIELEEMGSWLVTNEKIEKGKTISKLLGIPFLGFLYLVRDKLSLFWKITDENGEYLFDFKIEETETQANINGGTAIRPNAYLPYEHAQFVKSLKK